LDASLFPYVKGRSSLLDFNSTASTTVLFYAMPPYFFQASKNFESGDLELEVLESETLQVGTHYVIKPTGHIDDKAPLVEGRVSIGPESEDPAVIY
jgi:hypothetical protein